MPSGKAMILSYMKSSNFPQVQLHNFMYSNF